jgi:hypothetical protein
MYAALDLIHVPLLLAASKWCPIKLHPAMTKSDVERRITRGLCRQHAEIFLRYHV